jgi:GT2 family glycosyltransferase
VSFVIPVYDGERTLEAALAAVVAEARGRTAEVLVVDDGSSDRSLAIAESFRRRGEIELLRGPGRGAAAALNAGVRRARFEIVCQVDQDVVLDPGWLEHVLAALAAAPDAAAAQARYRVDRRQPLLARAAGLDLELRTQRLARSVDHVCTGNTAYRARALRAVGLFDEAFGYGYDNCLSYRLAAAGHRLLRCPEATSVHHWRSSLRGYLRQQFGVAYGRLDLIAKYPGRFAGDQVSGPGMILHAAATALALACVALGGAGLAVGARVHGPAAWLLAAGLALLGLLAVERGVAALRAAHRFRDPAALLFPAVHALRDAAWVAAIAAWLAHRLLRRAPAPRHSMRRARG